MPITYARHKRYWRQFHQYAFELNDQFAKPTAAVFPSPQICQPGPGSWLVTDLDSRMSIPAGGGLLWAGGSNAWDRCILVSTTPFAHKAGTYCEFEITPTGLNDYIRAGWNFNQGTSGGTGANGAILYNEACMYITGAGTLDVVDGLDVVAPLYPLTLGTSYLFRIYDTGTGWLYYVRPTASAANTWTLLWERTHSFPKVPHFNLCVNNHGQPGTSAHFFVRQGKVKPAANTALAPVANLLLSGAADSLVSVEMKAPANDTRALVFRYSNAQNYWAAVLNNLNQTLQLTKTVAGTTSVVSNTGVTWQTGAFYRLSALTFANHIRIFWGVQGPVYTDDNFNQSAVLFGMGPTAGGGGFNAGDAINLRCQTGGALLLN